MPISPVTYRPATSQLRLALWLCLLSTMIFHSAMAADTPAFLADQVVPMARPAGAIKASDVSMRALKKANTDEAIAAGHAFHITRLDWCYSKNAEWITKIKEQGWSYMGALINQTKVRLTWRYKADGSWWLVPWFTWVDPKDPSESLPCYNDPYYERMYVDSAKAFIDQGFSCFHKDDSQGNMDSLGAGCCFCPDCTTKAKAAGVDLTDKKQMATFQKESVLAFYARTRETLEAYAKQPITLSGNLDLKGPIGPAFDWAIQECQKDWVVKPSFILDRVQAARRMGKVQAFTAQHDWGTERFRIGIATLTSCGSNLIVPWDQYINMDKKGTRLFAEPKDLAGFYGFIRGIADRLDGYELAAVAGFDMAKAKEAKGGVAAVTGADKVSAWLRVKPKDTKAPLVIHLTNAATDAGACSLRLRTDALFAGKAFTAEWLVPAPYDAGAHAAAETAHDYRRLVVHAVIEPSVDGDASVFAIAAVQPWGVLVLTPR